jgi:hypothetical protein
MIIPNLMRTLTNIAIVKTPLPFRKLAFFHFAVKEISNANA